jgi:hypothetical protein
MTARYIWWAVGHANDRNLYDCQGDDRHANDKNLYDWQGDDSYGTRKTGGCLFGKKMISMRNGHCMAATGMTGISKTGTKMTGNQNSRHLIGTR